MKLVRSLPSPLALATLVSTGCLGNSLPVGTIDDSTGTDTEADGAATEPPTTSSFTSSIPPSTDDQGNSEITGDDPPDTDDQLTGGDDLDPECDMTNPELEATAIVDIGDWPVADPFDLQISAPCTVDVVVEGGSTVETTMTCDDEGIERPFSVTTSAPTAPVTWGPGDIVWMSHSYYDYDEGVYNTSVSLHRSEDGDLLMAAYEGGEGDTNVFDPTLIAPLGLSLDFDYCGGQTGVVRPLLMTFIRGKEDSLALVGGHHGTLQTGDDTEQIDIVVPEALTGWKGESAHTFHFLLQREQAR